MIELHRKENCTTCDEIQTKLEEMTLAHKIIQVEEASVEVPFVKEGQLIVKGKEEIKEYLGGVNRELVIMREISGDACYLDPETGLVC